MRAKQLLAEARYPNGFDGGKLTPNPPYNSMAEAVAGLPGRRAGGNAATRIEGLATRTGRYAYGVLPEVEDLHVDVEVFRTGGRVSSLARPDVTIAVADFLP